MAPTDAIRLANSGALLLDVRDAKAFEEGHIIDARHLPAAEVASRADSLKKHKDKPVIIYCESGFSAAGAARALRAAGFTKIATLRGGLNAWRQENLPLVKGAAKKEGKRS